MAADDIETALHNARALILADLTAGTWRTPPWCRWWSRP